MMDLFTDYGFMSSLHYCSNASLIFLCFVRRRCLFPVHLPFRTELPVTIEGGYDGEVTEVAQLIMDT